MVLKERTHYEAPQIYVVLLEPENAILEGSTESIGDGGEMSLHLDRFDELGWMD